MKKLTTILCSVCFMIAGVCLVLSNQSISTSNSAYAAVPPIPSVGTIHMDESALPLDLQLDLAKKCPDTVLVETHDTVYLPPTKPKRRKSHMGKKLITAMDTVPAKVKQDTLYVPALYIIVPLEYLHESNDTLIASK